MSKPQAAIFLSIVIVLMYFSFGLWKILTFISHHTCCRHTVDSEHTNLTQKILKFPAWNVHKRDQLIKRAALTVFKEETEALELLTLFSWAMPLMVYSTSLLDTLVMVIYQKWLHPWRRILFKVRAMFPFPKVSSKI